MSEVARSITVTADDKNIVVIMPIKTLIWACEHNPDGPLKVKDKKGFVRYLTENFAFHDEDETGATALNRLLDELFVAAYEDGVDMEEATP